MHQRRVLLRPRAEEPLDNAAAPFGGAVSVCAEAAFSPERAVLFEDHMEINYERGTLPAEENSFTIVLDLDEDVKALLHPWAVPQETPEE